MQSVTEISLILQSCFYVLIIQKDENQQLLRQKSDLGKTPICAY